MESTVLLEEMMELDEFVFVVRAQVSKFIGIWRI